MFTPVFMYKVQIQTWYALNGFSSPTSHYLSEAVISNRQFLVECVGLCSVGDAGFGARKPAYTLYLHNLAAIMA